MIKAAERVGDMKEYFFSIKLKEIQKLREEGSDIINLGIGSPDLPPSVEVIEALHSSAQNKKNHGYQPYHGTKELRQAISGWLKKTYCVLSDPESEILPLLGSKEGILHISLAFVNPGDIVLIPEIGYPAYRSISKMIGAKILEYPLNESYYPDFEHFTEEMKSAKLLWCNYPHMPSGTKATLEVFYNLVQYGKKTNTLICHDNPYSTLLNPNPLSIHSVDADKDVSLELNSLSKSHNMAGWRVGWISGKKEYISSILKIKSNIDSGMFRGIQDSAVEALRLDESWYTHQNEIYRKRQETAFQILKTLGCEYNPVQAGMFVWGKVPNGVNSVEFSDKILHTNHIFVTPGRLFGEKSDDHIRISLCSDLPQLEKALERLKH